MKLFEPIDYKTLKARQQENFNFQKIAGHLADFGYNCIRLSDDWQGADFIAYHVNGDRFLKVQLKARLTIDEKYSGKTIFVAFLDGQDCYVYPHDVIMESLIKKVGGTKSWNEGRSYSWPSLSKKNKELLKDYLVNTKR